MGIAPMDRVRVYSRGATVVRVVSLEAATPSVEVPGLPLSLIDSTVRVRSLHPEVVAGAVQVGLHVAAPEELPEPPDEAALRAVKRRIEQIDELLEILSAEGELLRSLDVPNRPQGEEGKPPPPSPMRARVALEQFTDSAIAERLASARKLREERAEKQEEQRALLDAIERASTARTADANAITKVVVVELSGTGTGVKLEVEYFVPGARWAPQYQCDIQADGSGAAIKLRALVCQSTGEDWSQVALELSTAAPHSFSQLPSLSSLRIGKAQPSPASRGYREPPRGAASLYGDFDRERARVSALLPKRSGRQFPELDVPYFTGVRSLLEEDGFAEVAPMVMGAADMVFEECDDEAPMPMPPPAAAPTAGRRRASPKQKKMARKPAPGGARRDEAEASPATPATPLPVSFTMLRLASAKSAGRGTLRASDRTDIYQRFLRRSGLRVKVDVGALVSAAQKRAKSASDQALPTGAVRVRDAAGHFDYVYRADDRVDVQSDLAFHSIPLGTREAECEVTYVVVPRVDPNVFRVASIDNPTRAPLLPGPAEVYVGGEYVLSTALPLVAPGERFRLGLGVEQGIRCARNTKYREERSGTNVVAMAELHHHIEIELNNQLSRSVKCEVRERIPQPDQDAEVDVEEVGVEPPWEPWDQLELKRKIQGGRRWRVELPARETTKVSAHYAVKIYANNEVVGGNRRES